MHIRSCEILLFQPSSYLGILGSKDDIGVSHSSALFDVDEATARCTSACNEAAEMLKPTAQR